MLKHSSVALVIGLSLASAAMAQQQPQVPGLADIVPVIEQQRNRALSDHAVAQGRVSELTRENDALKGAVADRDRKAVDAGAALADRDQKIAGLDKALAEASAKIAELQAKLAAAVAPAAAD